MPKGTHMQVGGDNIKKLFPEEILKIAILSGNISSISFDTSRRMERDVAIQLLNVLSFYSTDQGFICTSVAKSASSFPLRLPSTTIVTTSTRNNDHLPSLRGFDRLVKEEGKPDTDLTVIVRQPNFDDALFLLLTEELINPSSIGNISFSFSGVGPQAKSTSKLEANLSAEPELKLFS